MKTTIKLLAIALIGCAIIASCNRKPADNTPTTPTDSVSADNALLDAIDRYLTDSIGAFYAPGEVCIPCHTVIALTDSANVLTKVWGDFWVFNYNIAGDTLKTVSGGSHAGLMLLTREGDRYAVTGFDVVLDGNDNITSAQRIFGDRYEAFHAVNSDEKQRESTRARAIADYVKRNNLSVKYYQDYGWPAVALPVAAE